MARPRNARNIHLSRMRGVKVGDAMTGGRMSAVLLLCVLLAAPLRAEPNPQGVDPVVLKLEDAPADEHAKDRLPCIVSPMIFVRSAQPHVDGVKAQLRDFLARTSGSAAATSTSESVYALRPPRHGLVALAFMQDALGGVIMARVDCAGPVKGDDADAAEYVRSLHDQIRDMRLIVTSIQLINFVDSLEKMKPGETKQVGGQP